MEGESPQDELRPHTRGSPGLRAQDHGEAQRPTKEESR